LEIECSDCGNEAENLTTVDPLPEFWEKADGGEYHVEWFCWECNQFVWEYEFDTL
jgi:hypothetical protein